MARAFGPSIACCLSLNLSFSIFSLSSCVLLQYVHLERASHLLGLPSSPCSLFHPGCSERVGPRMIHHQHVLIKTRESEDTPTARQ